ncbi:hypothetical protein COU20_00045 [Candidatus Kaiserbacteria bacterium CG10_big_fil_rev_8_21_14_0_10_59_10]|uniref:YtkA-like domain-containing protein n=1 Tax=Candidatus Kaiserbacteria bacterium CG10_big_fil_rev_8_21_14_0_10_59_10 TaxID=1974612 RepID=A0A2H0U8Y4_9BACT|nr:MAG: hypothetical protein COU20_00045 [Candidatus Kaiserbacteria bacterium CG10_big_fil_rev_8_21_14_0_10_59_10]
MRASFALCLSVAALLCAPAALSAHALGASFEKESGPYLIDIGYAPEEFSADRTALFEFELTEDGAPVPFDDVWVRITREEKTVFAGGIHNARFGGARMTYLFPKSGSYELSVRYERGLESVAEASFPLVVLPAEGGGTLRNLALAGIIGLLIGAAGSYALARRRG